MPNWGLVLLHFVPFISHSDSTDYRLRSRGWGELIGKKRSEGEKEVQLQTVLGEQFFLCWRVLSGPVGFLKSLWAF